jgi:5-methylcytosine-specific restriction endonuclease McrA
LVNDVQTPSLCLPVEEAAKLRSSGAYEHQCAWCGSAFYGAWHAKFCSDRCRVKSHRVASGQQQARSISLKTRFNVFSRDDYRCQMCGRNADEHKVVLHIDHMLPVSRGGSDDISNLITLCSDCNMGKGTDAISVVESVGLDPDIIEAFRATGPGWQARINDTLRKHRP